MKDSNLLAMITGKNTTDIWGSINSYLMECDDPAARNIHLNKIMAALVFTNVNGGAFRNTLRDNSLVNPSNTSANDVSLRAYIRKSISQLNEAYPFDVADVQERVLAAIHTQREVTQMLSNGSIDSSLKYMQLLESFVDAPDNEEGSIEKQLGYEAIEQLLDIGTVKSEEV